MFDPLQKIIGSIVIGALQGAANAAIDLFIPDIKKLSDSAISSLSRTRKRRIKTKRSSKGIFLDTKPKRIIRRSISPSLRQHILQRDKKTCQHCGAKAPKVQLEVDHILPVSKGGSNDPSNLQTLCFACNRGKSNRYRS